MQLLADVLKREPGAREIYEERERLRGVPACRTSGGRCDPRTSAGGRVRAWRYDTLWSRVQIHFPNSAHLRNLQGFLRKCDFSSPTRLVLSTHPKWVSVHPVALAMTAAAGLAVRREGGSVELAIPNPKMDSIRYLTRMKLFEALGLEAPTSIQEHEAAGRFIPITQIETPQQLSNFLVDMVPLLHATRDEVEPIQYVISELVRNVLEHSASPIGAVLCAQYYATSKRLALGVADRGIGIRSSLEWNYPVHTDMAAIMLALRPGVTGTTKNLYGTDYNAGAGLFFTKSIACASRNFFALYSGQGLFKLLGTPKKAKEIVIRGNPEDDYHLALEDLPPWPGTVAGIDVSVQAGQTFAQLLDAIRQVYRIDKQAERRKGFKKPRFG
jgi:hypothetical protein